MTGTPYFHALDTVTITDPASKMRGHHGVVQYVYPNAVLLSVWLGTWPPARVQVAKTGIQHREIVRP